MTFEFRWNDWNRDHATKHGITEAEAEGIVRRGPGRLIGDGKYRAVGRDRNQRLAQVVYVIDDEGATFIIHARPLTDREKSVNGNDHEQEQTGKTPHG